MAAADEYDDTIQQASREWNVDPILLKSLILQESNGNPRAVSKAGARGLTQLMPDTARALGVTDPHDPVQSIYGGAKYLSEALDAEGHPDKALLYYHGGPGWRRAYGPESAGYVPGVAGHYQRLSQAKAQADSTQPQRTQLAANDTHTATDATPGPAKVTDDEFLQSTGATSKGGKPARKAPEAGGQSDDDFLKATGATATPSAAPQETTDQPQQPAAALPPVSEYGDLGNAWWNTKADAPPGEAPGSLPVVGGKTPGYVHSDILPLARREDVINDPNSHWWQGWAVGPGPLRALGQSPAENVLINPSTGGMSLAPEALTAATTLAGVGARPLVGGPREFVAPGALDAKAPLSPEFKANPLSAEGKAAAAEPPAGPTSSTGVPAPPPPPPPQPKFAGAGASTDALGAKTSADAKAVAGKLYAKADAAGGTLTPAFTDKFIDEAGKIAPQTEAGRVVAGATPVTALAARLADLKGKPITLQGAQEIDRAIGGMIEKEYTPRGLSGDGKELLDLQSKFRDMIANAEESEVTGGKAGFDAVVEARKAWSQAMKMQDLERIQERANMTDNPATGIKSGIRTLLSNPSRSRAYSPEEISALKDAASRGVLGGALHVFGSRLIPIAAGAAGYSGGILGTLTGAGAAHVLTSGSRAAATALQTRRMQNALDTLGRSVPPAPPP